MPTDPTEYAKLMSQAKDWVKENIEKGFTVSWGAFMTGSEGYAVVEGDPPDVYKNLQKFYPAFVYQIHEVLSVDELPEVA